MEQLLKILEDNARLPIEDIATMLNKSPAEVAAMIDLARAQGIIKGYKTLARRHPSCRASSTTSLLYAA